MMVESGSKTKHHMNNVRLIYFILTDTNTERLFALHGRLTLVCHNQELLRLNSLRYTLTADVSRHTVSIHDDCVQIIT